MLSDFYSLHPSFKHNDFLGDAAFDSVDTYEFLLHKNENGNSLFNRAFIPLNSRATTNKPNCPFNENGIPVCPNDHSLSFRPDGISNEKGRPLRQKWRCPKSKFSNKQHICTCENPCCSSKTGRVVYTYPDKNFRLYPGTLRGTDEWNKLYKIRNFVLYSYRITTKNFTNIVLAWRVNFYILM